MSGSVPASMKAVVFEGPGKVSVKEVSSPTFSVKLFNGEKRECQHGVIVKAIASCICGSDLHMVHGRTDMPAGSVLGHEITGEVVAVGTKVNFIKMGDIVSIPFNVACGCCQYCKSGLTNSCLTTNPDRPGAAYGYAQMGGWMGCQAQYALIPYADFNCLRIPQQYAMEKIRDIALLTDIFPTGFHPAFSAGVTAGSTVYIAGAGPVGRACAASCSLLGAAAVVIGDFLPSRLEQMRKMGCYTIDLSDKNVSIPEQLDKLLGERAVDVAIDCVGYEARMHGGVREAPMSALSDCILATRIGGKIGVPGVYMPVDPRGVDTEAKAGALSIPFGSVFNKGIQLVGVGQCPVAIYNRRLMSAILYDKIKISDWVNTTTIPIDDAPKAYETFDHLKGGSSDKFILDPNDMIGTEKWTSSATKKRDLTVE